MEPHYKKAVKNLTKQLHVHMYIKWFSPNSIYNKIYIHIYYAYFCNIFSVYVNVINNNKLKTLTT